MTRFDRDGLVLALRQLVAKLGATGERGGIRIVGGAALALRYFERESTIDIDAHPVGDAAHILAAGREIAEANGWPEDRLNNQAAGFIPEYGPSATTWETLYDDGDVVIQVASAEAMLAMKLRANRPGRDDVDIAKLMVICDTSPRSMPPRNSTSRTTPPRCCPTGRCGWSHGSSRSGCPRHPNRRRRWTSAIRTQVCRSVSSPPYVARWSAARAPCTEADSTSAGD